MSDELLKKISIAKNKRKAPRNKIINHGSAAKVAIDFIASIGVGAFIGFEIDRYCDTSPIFTILCTITGMIAGLLNLYRSTINVKPKRDQQETNK